MDNVNDNNLVCLADELCPVDDTLLNFFTEVMICDDLEIPPQKPDKEHITNVITKVLITDKEVIEVNLGDEIRKKVILTGKLRVGIEYSALEPEQQVHFAHFDIPIQGIIGFRPCVEDPEDPDFNRGLLPECFDLDNYNIHYCVEHKQFHQLSPRDIKAVLVVLLWLKPKLDVQIVTPTDGATVSGAVNVVATVSGDAEVESVIFEYSEDGGETFNEFGTDEEAPYEATLTTIALGLEGEVLIRATAVDACTGTIADTDTITVTVDNS